MSQHSVIIGRVGKAPEIKPSKKGHYIKIPVCVSDYIFGKSVTQWYQCCIFSPSITSLQNVVKNGFLDKGAIVSLSGKQYLIDRPSFKGMGFACNQSELEIIVGANNLKCKTPDGISSDEYQEDQVLESGKPLFKYDDDLPY